MLLFSVITICYNDALHLERTLRSVAEQKETFPSIQYIVVDGASTDATPKLLAQYGETVDLLISEPDKGIYDAMNKGLKAVRGDYVCFLNSGDKFHAPGQLYEVFERVSKEYAGRELPGVIYGETDLVDEKGTFLRKRTPRPPRSLSHASFLRGMCVCHQSFYARTTLCEAYDDESYRLSGDFDWCLDVLHKSKDNFDTGLTLTDYLAEGLTTRNRRASLVERLRIMIRHYGLLPAVLAHVWFLFRTPASELRTILRFW